MNIREPVVSGTFYPAKKDALLKMISSMLNTVNLEKTYEDKNIFGLISPHAGYVYSGTAAAYGYSLLKGRKYDTIIILGPSHYTLLNGASVWKNGQYSTPLGKIDIDTEATNFLLDKYEHIEFNQIAHIQEHSIEVQLPFLQYVLKSDFKFVPIIIGNQQLDYIKKLTEALINLLNTNINKKYLFIASTDLSHYHSSDVALRMDGNVASAIESFDIEKLNTIIEERTGEACGIGPILTLMLLSEKLNIKNVDILKLTNSGETSGDYSRVVGYMSAVLYKE